MNFFIDKPDNALSTISSEKTATESSKEPASKEHRNHDTKKHKVLTISEAKSFPLDDLLPIKKRKLSGDLETDKQTKPAQTSETVPEATVYESYFTAASDHYSQTVINGSRHDYESNSVFHGTVYETETQYETSEWPHRYQTTCPTSNIEVQALPNDDTIGRQSVKMEQNLFTSPLCTNSIPIAGPSENNFWTDPLRNMLSQQTANELQDFASRLNIATYLSSDTPVSFANDRVCMDGDRADIRKVNEDVPNYKGDSAAGSEKLADLIEKLQSCISIVESKTDREELVCLIDVLKRETGNEKITTGFTPPRRPVDDSNITVN